MESIMDEKTSIVAGTRLPQHYGSDPVRFSGHPDALLERHLLFNDLIDPSTAGARQTFEAAARSVRDVLSRRWSLTQRTYHRENPKRIYYLSMEFLIGRSLTNNITNLLLDRYVEAAAREASLDWLELIEQEPDAGLGNGGLGRLAACFLDSMATMQLPATGYGLRYEYGMFRQAIENGWQREYPDNWLHHQDPWEVARPSEAVEVKLGCSFEMHRGKMELVAGRPSTLIGIPFDRPVVGFGGKTINTLRLWRAAAHDYFDFKEFSGGDFVGALVGNIAASTLTRVLYPDDSTEMGQELRFAQEYFLVACSMADLVRRFRRDNSDWNAFPEKVAIQLNDTHPTLAVPELMRILLDEAGFGWEAAWDLTQRTLAYTNHTLLPEALEKWPLHYFREIVPRQLEIIFEINAFSRRRAAPLSQRRSPRCAHEPDRRGSGGQSANGQPGDRRLAQHQRCRRHPFPTAARDHGPRSRGDVPGTVQQQDQRRDAAALAADGKSGAVGRHQQRDWGRLDHRFQRDRGIEVARQRCGLPRGIPAGQARGQIAICPLAAIDLRANRRPRLHLRLPGQAHP
jgi:glycogen phosphorylase